MLTKDDIDLAEQEFVLCWQDSAALLGDAIMHPKALGYEYRWEEICDAARRGINHEEEPIPQPDQFPDAGQKVDLSGKIAPEGGSWELLNEWERASAADPSMSVRCQSAGDDMVRCIRELEAKLAEANRTLQGFNYVSPHEADLREKLEAAETELARYQRCYWANEGKYETLTAQVAKLRAALEYIAHNANAYAHQWVRDKARAALASSAGDDKWVLDSEGRLYPAAIRGVKE